MNHKSTIRAGKAGHRHTPRCRTGVTIIETVVAVALLSVFLVSSARVMATFSAQQRTARRHALALQSANNLLEELSNQSWQSLTPEATADWAANASKIEGLPGAVLSATVVEEPEPVAAKRVSVSLAWTIPGGRPAAPIRLTAWVYRPAQVESPEQPETDEP